MTNSYSASNFEPDSSNSNSSNHSSNNHSDSDSESEVVSSDSSANSCTSQMESFQSFHSGTQQNTQLGPSQIPFTNPIEQEIINVEFIDYSATIANINALSNAIASLSPQDQPVWFLQQLHQNFVAQTLQSFQNGFYMILSVPSIESPLTEGIRKYRQLINDWRQPTNENPHPIQTQQAKASRNAYWGFLSKERVAYASLELLANIEVELNNESLIQGTPVHLSKQIRVESFEIDVLRQGVGQSAIKGFRRVLPEAESNSYQLKIRRANCVLQVDTRHTIRDQLSAYQYDFNTVYVRSDRTRNSQVLDITPKAVQTLRSTISLSVNNPGLGSITASRVLLRSSVAQKPIFIGFSQPSSDQKVTSMGYVDLTHHYQGTIESSSIIGGVLSFVSIFFAIFILILLLLQRLKNGKIGWNHLILFGLLPQSIIFELEFGFREQKVYGWLPKRKCIEIGQMKKCQIIYSPFPLGPDVTKVWRSKRLLRWVIINHI